MMQRHVLSCLIAAYVTAVTSGHQAPSGSGFSAADFDTSVRPQDDLYRHVNSRWLASTPMPDDRVSHNAATEIVEKTNEDVRAIIEELAASGDRRPGSPAQQVADLYASMMNEAAIEARGITPLQAELSAIDAIDSIRALADRAGRLSATTTSGPFSGSVGQDPNHPEDRIVHIAQGGLLLERDRYLQNDDWSRSVRAGYESYLERVFAIVGRENPRGDAAAVLAIETELAAAHIPPNGAGAQTVSTQPLSLTQMNSMFPGFDWNAWGRPQGLDRIAGVVAMQPSFFRTFAAMVPQRPLATWRAWLAGRYITAMSTYANQALNDARFDFFGKFLTGQERPIVRWKRAVGLVNRMLGDSVGRLYAAKHFPRASRIRVERIVENVVRGYRLAIGEAAWMSGGARAEAQAKLELLKTRVGYPDVWRDYRGLEIKPDDLFGNLLRAQAFDNNRRMARMARMARPDERGEWTVSGPQSVNAYYVPAQNEIMLPAAFLQPPYFNADADDAVNYGAIGAVVGHEIMHGLDGTGRYYDGNGAARDWWRPQDERAFITRVQTLLDDIGRYPAIDGQRVNGALAIAESMGDVAGLSVAYRAYQLSLAGRPSPVIDGLTGDQRFFLGWARIWRTKERPEYRRQLLLFSRYAPADYRANGTAAHLDAFYRAFDIGPGDKGFLPPEKRARIF
jgi:predicted metalloendopeptidase